MAQPGPGAVAIEGLAELQRAFNAVSRDLGKGVREALEAAGEPVRSEASRLAREEISGMARSRLPWYTMRTGVTRHSIYVAPLQRGVKSRSGGSRRRPNLATLLLEKAMEPALEQNRERAVHEISETLDDLFRMWERI